ELRPLLVKLERGTEDAAHLITLLKSFNLPTETALAPCFLALIPEGDSYGYFGKTIKASDGWQAPVEEYTTYLSENSVEYSHSKRSLLGTKPFMVGSMARLFFFSDKLGKTAKDIFDKSPLAQKNKRVSSLWNNFAQAIEIVEAIERATVIIEILLTSKIAGTENTDFKNKLKAGRGVGAVECPRGTLYHSYTLDESGNITAADMITPSAQNSAHIELDIRKAAELELKKAPDHLRSTLETLVRAYDPCNTCATHMVSVRQLK
ncbi:MAG: nickel-dependent hydrogenase large subunit, partial [Cyanobacteria bacterium SZAS LIN-5]|nr:nickel-dependent hydrogenase large subunit [Cyanobacteria bacterium SZAS LIN-5]